MQDFEKKKDFETQILYFVWCKNKLYVWAYISLRTLNITNYQWLLHFVYFDQLFSGVFYLFCSFQTFFSDVAHKIKKKRMKMNKKNSIYSFLSTLQIWSTGARRTQNLVEIYNNYVTGHWLVSNFIAAGPGFLPGGW